VNNHDLEADQVVQVDLADNVQDLLRDHNKVADNVQDLLRDHNKVAGPDKDKVADPVKEWEAP
jgi:hypothetical protein